MSDYPGLSRQQSTSSEDHLSQRASFEWVTAQREEYLESLRKHSCYPAYRSLIEILRTVGIVAIAFGALGVVIAFLNDRNPTVLLGLLGLGISYYVISILKDSAHMIADIGDATIDANLISLYKELREQSIEEKEESKEE